MKKEKMRKLRTIGRTLFFIFCIGTVLFWYFLSGIMFDKPYIFVLYVLLNMLYGFIFFRLERKYKNLEKL